MSDSNPVQGVTDPNAVTTAPNATTGAPTGAAAPGYTAATGVNNMEDLKAKAPEVYRAMMEGIAMNITNQMKAHQDKLKEMQREAQRNAEGKS